jgi:hypothetical protein
MRLPVSRRNREGVKPGPCFVFWNGRFAGEIQVLDFVRMRNGLISRDPVILKDCARFSFADFRGRRKTDGLRRIQMQRRPDDQIGDNPNDCNGDGPRGRANE